MSTRRRPQASPDTLSDRPSCFVLRHGASQCGDVWCGLHVGSMFLGCTRPVDVMSARSIGQYIPWGERERERGVRSFRHVSVDLSGHTQIFLRRISAKYFSGTASFFRSSTFLSWSRLMHTRTHTHTHTQHTRVVHGVCQASIPFPAHGVGWLAG